MSLKASRYNHFVEQRDGSVLAYNAFTNTLAQVSGEQYAAIQGMLEDPDHFACDTEEKADLYADLCAGSFLVDADLDELGLLRLNQRRARFSTSTLGLTIAPTLSCKFACTYCYEQTSAEHMTPETEDAVIAFVERRAKRLDTLQVNWFGGEPTLRMNTIDRLTQEFRKICAASSIQLAPASIITNGYLLTAEVARQLRALGVTSAQITLDGPPDVHNARRRLRGGQPTFDRIVKNIQQSRDLIDICIRINLDRTNANRMDEFYSVWKNLGLLNQVPFYFGQVMSNTEACKDVASSCHTTSEHSAVVVELYRRALERGIWTGVGYPTTRHFGACTAECINGFVVAPSGMLFKCWTELAPGTANTVGSVHTDPSSLSIPQLETTLRYANWDPLADAGCSDCGHLPICAGGCAYKGQRAGTPDCSQYKFNLAEILRLKSAEIARRGFSDALRQSD